MSGQRLLFFSLPCELVSSSPAGRVDSFLLRLFVFFVFYI